MDTLGGLVPSDSDFPRRGCFVLWYRFVFYFRRVTLDWFCFFPRRTLWTRFLFYFRVLWTRFVFYLRGKTGGGTRHQPPRPRARVDEHAAGPRRHPALVRSESLRGLNPRFLGSPVQEPTVRARLRPELLGQPPVGRLHLFGTARRTWRRASRARPTLRRRPKEEAAAGIMRHRTRESSGTKRTN